LALERALVAALPALALACGALPRFSADDVGCRETVTADGERAPAQVRWYYIDDPEDRRFQNAWCVGVGPAVVWRAPEPVGQELVAAASTTATTRTTSTPSATPGETLVSGGATAANAEPGTSEEPVLDSLLVVAYNAHIG